MYCISDPVPYVVVARKVLSALYTKMHFITYHVRAEHRVCRKNLKKCPKCWFTDFKWEKSIFFKLFAGVDL